MNISQVMNQRLKRVGLLLRDSMTCVSVNPRNYRLQDISPGDIPCSVYVSMFSMTARLTKKLSLAFAVALVAMSTHRTGTGRVARVNQAKRHAITDAPVCNKLPKLVEAPTMMLCPLRLSKPCPIPNTAQIFKLDFSGCALCRFNEGSSNLVVGVASKTCFSTCYFLESTFSRTCAARLQACSVVLILLAFSFNIRTRKAHAVRGGGDVIHAKVYAQSSVRFLRRLVSKAALQVDIPLAAPPSNELTTLDRLSGSKQVPLVVTNRQRHLEASVNGSQAKHFVFKAKNTLVIIYRRCLKATRALPFALTDPCNSSNSKVGAQVMPLPNIRVAEFLQGKLRKVVFGSRYLKHVITRGRKSINGAAQAFGLTRTRLDFAAHATEGHMTDYNSQATPTQAADAAQNFLPPLKEWASVLVPL